MSPFAVTVRAALKPYHLILPAPVRAVIEVAADHIDALQLRVDHIESELKRMKDVQSLGSSETEGR